MSRSFLRPVPALVFALAAGAAPLAAVQRSTWRSASKLASDEAMFLRRRS